MRHQITISDQPTITDWSLPRSNIAMSIKNATASMPKSENAEGKISCHGPQPPATGAPGIRSPIVAPESAGGVLKIQPPDVEPRHQVLSQYR